MDYDYFTSYVWMRKQDPVDLMFIMHFVAGMPEEEVLEMMTALRLGTELPEKKI